MHIVTNLTYRVLLEVNTLLYYLSCITIPVSIISRAVWVVKMVTNLNIIVVCVDGSKFCYN